MGVGRGKERGGKGRISMERKYDPRKTEAMSRSGDLGKEGRTGNGTIEKKKN